MRGWAEGLQSRRESAQPALPGVGAAKRKAE